MYLQKKIVLCENWDMKFKESFEEKIFVPFIFPVFVGIGQTKAAELPVLWP